MYRTAKLLTFALVLAGCTGESDTTAAQSQTAQFADRPCLAGQPSAGDAAYSAGRYEEAFRAWSPCAEQGDVGSQFALAIYLSDGTATTPDLVEAYKWAMLATDGESFLATLLEQQMTASQLAAARALIGAWHPAPRLER